MRRNALENNLALALYQGDRKSIQRVSQAIIADPEIINKTFPYKVANSQGGVIARAVSHGEPKAQANSPR